MPLKKDRNTPARLSDLFPVPVAANAKIYAGALVVANATGYAAPGSTAAGLTYLGRCEEFVDNTGGADGVQVALVRRGKAFQFDNSTTDPVTQVSVGKVCYIVDDCTVAKTNGSNTRSAAGIVLGVDQDGVWVE